MTTGTRVIDSRHVSLGGRTFPIQGPVLRSLASRLPPKETQGDYTLESNPIVSTIVWNNHTGGIGQETQSDFSNKTWFSDLSLRHRNHLVLQRRVIQTGATAFLLGTGLTGVVAALTDLNEQIYAAYSATIQSYDNGADAWTTVRTMSATATDAITVSLADSTTAVFARTTGVDFSTNGSTWSQNEEDAEFLAFWRDLLWTIDSTGALKFTSNLTGSWTTVANLRSPALPTDLFTGPGVDPNEEVLYISAQDGLYFYDNLNERVVKTKLAVPFHPDNGRGSVAFRSAVYYPAGLSVYEYEPAFQQTTIDLVGLDGGDGVPEEQRGTITASARSHTDLIVGVSATVESAGAKSRNFSTGGAGFQRQAQFGDLNTGVAVYGWDGVGWETKWNGRTANADVKAMHVANLYGEYRLWWGSGNQVFYQRMSLGIINPNQVSTFEFESSGSWEGPWFDDGTIHQTKTAVAFHLETENPTSSETALLQYQLNYDTTTTVTVGTNTTTEDKEYILPIQPIESEEGVAFRAIRPILNLTRGGLATTSSPDVKKLALVYVKSLEVLYAFTFQIILNEDLRRTALENRDFLQRIFDNKSTDGLGRVLQEFTYRDEMDNVQNHWVKPINLEAIEETGHEDDFRWQVTVVQAV